MDCRLFLVAFLSLAAEVLAQNNDLANYIQQNCAQNPSGNNSQAFHISHPNYCNAFFTCDPPNGHYQCTFCGEGLYYPRDADNCASLNGAEPQSLCDNNREYARHEDKVFIQADGRCAANGLINQPVNPPPFQG